jgi:hypothetical protein
VFYASGRKHSYPSGGWTVNAVLVEKLLGGDREWSGPCVVVLDAEASVKTPGPDSVVTGGQKSYAPRFSSGRIEADACYLYKELSALVLVSQQSYKDSTGAAHMRQTLVVADLAHVVALDGGRGAGHQRGRVPGRDAGGVGGEEPNPPTPFPQREGGVDSFSPPRSGEGLLG